MPGSNSTNATASWALVALLFGAAAMRPACVDPNPGSGPGAGGDAGFETGAMLAAIGADVIVPALDAAAADAVDLESAVAAWAIARQTGDGAAARDAARDAWRVLMESWQEVELMQLGPAAQSTSAIAGQDLRDEVYSWPAANKCRVDQETVEAVYDDAGFFDENLVNVYGLDALEYLLWHPGDNDCAPQSPINANGTWAALGEDGQWDNRADYAAAIAARVRADIDRLVSTWDPDGGDFLGQFAGAGEGGSPYSTQLEAVNAVFDALFYLELQTKDAKLGLALGRVEGCSDTPCPQALESSLSDNSGVNLSANLRGFRALWTGKDGLGFDDLLVSIGEDELAGRVLTELDEADAKVAALSAPVGELLQSDIDQLNATYDEIKNVADILKNELPNVLVLQIPGEAGGDND